MSEDASPPDPPSSSGAPAAEGRSGARSRKLQLGLGLAISVVFLYLTFRGIEWDKVGDSLAGIRWVWLLPAVASFLAHFVVRSAVWRVFVRPLKPVGLGPLNEATVIGFTANNLLPARLGELARAYVLTSRERIPFASTFATVVLARVYDMLSLVVVVMIILLAMDLPDWMRASAFVLMPATAVGMGVLVALKVWEERTVALLERMAGWLPKKLGDFGMGLVRAFLPGLEALRGPRDLAVALVLSLLTWILITGYYVGLIWAFGFELPWFGSLVLVIAVALFIALPSAPGYVGVYHAGVVQGLALFPAAGIGENEALAFALVVHALQYVVTTGWGVGYLMRSSIGLGDLTSMAGEETSAATSADPATAPDPEA